MIQYFSFGRLEMQWVITSGSYVLSMPAIKIIKLIIQRVLRCDHSSLCMNFQTLWLHKFMYYVPRYVHHIQQATMESLLPGFEQWD